MSVEANSSNIVSDLDELDLLLSDEGLFVDEWNLEGLLHQNKIIFTLVSHALPIPIHYTGHSLVRCM